MKRHVPISSRRLTLLSAIVMALALCIAMPSCGTIRTHAGIEHDYRYDFDDGYRHHHKKHKKHKKYHKKHGHHHH